MAHIRASTESSTIITNKINAVFILGIAPIIDAISIYLWSPTSTLHASYCPVRSFSSICGKNCTSDPQNWSTWATREKKTLQYNCGNTDTSLARRKSIRGDYRLTYSRDECSQKSLKWQVLVNRAEIVSGLASDSKKTWPTQTVVLCACAR